MNGGRELWRALVFRACIKLMAQWLYSEAGNLKLPDPDLWLKVKTEALWPPITAFIANTKRLHAFWKLSPHLIEVATGHVLGIANAIFAVTGRPTLTEEEHHDEELQAKIQAKMCEEVIELFEATGDTEVATRYNFTRALDNFELLVKNDELGAEALYAAFCSQITSAWTAWETLATDLWEAALNYHPVGLAKLVGRKNRISKLAQSKQPEDEDDGAETKREAGPRLPDFDRITKGTYNAEKVMGTLLKREHKFQTLAGIRAAYSTAFSSDYGAIDAALSSAALERLSLVRNLIIHKAGVVDQTFVDKAVLVPGWETDCEIGKPLRLDGAIVRELLNPVFALGTDLIKAVDEWVAPKGSVAPMT